MTKSSKSFLIQQIVLTVITYFIGYILFQFVFTPHFFSFLIVLPLVFLALNAAFYFSIIRHAGKDIRVFTSRFLMLFGIKIMALLIFIVVYAYFNPANAVSFLITFFALYLINTIFVIAKVVNRLKIK